MAGQDSSQERTEQATPKRLREAAEKGQIARSRELTTLAMLLGAAGSLLILGPSLLEKLIRHMETGLTLSSATIFTPHAIPQLLRQTLMDLLGLVAPFLTVMVIIALLAPLALGGWTFSSEALSFKPERLDPIKGLGKLFSWRALMELGKALAKFLIIAIAAIILLRQKQLELLYLSREALIPALVHTAEIIGEVFLLLTLPMILIAAVDVPFQLFQHSQQLRMTKQEVKDEHKDTDGKPEVKGRIRRLQQELARRRMMEKIPQADVVIVNPEHYAVALRYQAATMAAPEIVALGLDQVALQIRELARHHQIPQVVSPLLARALYYNGHLDKAVPSKLYRAVAQVLAYLYQLRQEYRSDMEPIAMPDIPVPSDLRTQP